MSGRGVVLEQRVRDIHGSLVINQVDNVFCVGEFRGGDVHYAALVINSASFVCDELGV